MPRELVYYITKESYSYSVLIQDDAQAVIYKKQKRN